MKTQFHFAVFHIDKTKPRPYFFLDLRKSGVVKTEGEDPCFQLNLEQEKVCGRKVVCTFCRLKETQTRRSRSGVPSLNQTDLALDGNKNVCSGQRMRLGALEYQKGKEKSDEREN